MSPLRIAAALLLVVIVAPVLPTVAQAEEDPPLTPAEVNRLESEIREKERRVRDFDNAISKLKAGARQSSNSSLRSAVDNSMRIMADAIKFEERKIGQDNLIKMHGEYVTPVSSNELTKSRGVRTRRRPYLPYQTIGVPIEYLRLVRMQEIYISCKKMQEMAITRQGDAPERFGRITLEFEAMLKADLEELKAFLPEDSGPTYDSPYGINPDGSSKAGSNAKKDGG